MTRRFAIATVCLTGTVAFLVGLIVAGSLAPTPAVSAPARVERVAAVDPVGPVALAPVDPTGIMSFADVAERLNPAVVNIDATTKGRASRGRRFLPSLPDSPEGFDRRSDEAPRRGTGTGFVIDASGLILTNHHVIEGADRLMVRLTDGRTLRAHLVGSDPDTDIALIKVESSSPLPYATMGDSDTLRVGEWVCAIGNPLAYEHTVTVGVVSFIGRKLFNSSLDRYIQTDAAINLGNSGGPLINNRGEVIGINSAISSRASNIGFAVPINQAREILPQLQTNGRVSRGYIGVALKEVDADLQRSLRLRVSTGALVQDVTEGSPAARAGMRTYDLILAVDGKPVENNDALIQDIATRRPGGVVTLQVLRDGRAMTIPVKLAERPVVAQAVQEQDWGTEEPSDPDKPSLGLHVRDMDEGFVARHGLPDGVRGVVVVRVDTMSPAFDAEIARGHVLLEVNRAPVRSPEEYRRVMSTVRTGDVLALYIYEPQLRRHALRTIRVEAR